MAALGGFNCTFLIQFSDILGSSGLTTGILTWQFLAKIQTMAQPILPSMQLKYLKKVQ